MSSALLPDAAAGNWVDRLAPPSLRPWLKLGRFDRPAGIWLLLLPGWQAIGLAGAEAARGPDLILMLKMLVGAVLMRAAGCAFNDIVDRDIDAKVARTASRPLASGQISARQALAFLVLCSLVSLGVLVTMGPLAIGLGVASLALVAAYPFMKRITWWPQAWLGLTFNWGALLGYAAATGRLSAPAVLLYAAGLFWTLGYDTIYAVQDLEDDALAGVKSSARRLGAHTARGVMSFYLIAGALTLAAGFIAELGPLFYGIAALYVAHLVRQPLSLRLDDPQGALALFKSNRNAGLILLAAIIAGAFKPALSLFAGG